MPSKPPESEITNSTWDIQVRDLFVKMTMGNFAHDAKATAKFEVAFAAMQSHSLQYPGTEPIEFLNDSIRFEIR